MERQCSRPGCAEVAAATLTYQYVRGTAWLDGLTGEREPHAYDLCEHHADRVNVPRGWRFVDRRPLPMEEPAAAGTLLPAPVAAAFAVGPAGDLPVRLAG